jgi:hypothetical protein
MTIQGEERDVGVGDLVHFAVSFMPEGATEAVPA